MPVRYISCSIRYNIDNQQLQTNDAQQTTIRQSCFSPTAEG